MQLLYSKYGQKTGSSGNKLLFFNNPFASATATTLKEKCARKNVPEGFLFDHSMIL
jgi:hypothetical protein